MLPATVYLHAMAQPGSCSGWEHGPSGWRKTESAPVTIEAPEVSKAPEVSEAPGAQLKDKIQVWQTTLHLAQLKEKAAEVTGLPWEDFLAYREFALSRPKCRDTTLLLQAGEKRVSGHLPWGTWHQLQEFAMIMGDDIMSRKDVPRGPWSLAATEPATARWGDTNRNCAPR